MLALAFSAAAGAQAEEEEPDPRVQRETPEDEAPPVPAVPLQDRPVMLLVGGSLSHDSNLFRSPSASEERISIAYAGLRIDKAYAQQRIRADVTWTAYRYDNFPHLDFEGLNYLGAWEWRLTPRISGTLRARREESLADYSEFRNPGQQNVRTTEHYSAVADAWIFGGWHVTGGFTQERRRYSVPFPQEGSYRAGGGEAGLKWVAASANWLAFNLRSLDGRYVDRPLDPVLLLDDGFRRNEAEALAYWRITGKSLFEGRAAWIDYRSDHFAERDFSGLAARLRYAWSATAKFSLAAQLSRELEPWAEAAASYRVEERVALAPLWQPFARTTLRLEASRAESDFRGALPGFAGTPRHDRLDGLNFEAEWRALRNLLLKAGAARYRQSSTDPAANFRGSLLTVGASLLF